MNRLTGIKDLDREILSNVDDRELLNICTIDKRFWNDVCDDNFLRRRLLSKYPGIEKYKGNKSWKQFFLNATFYISIMKEKFDYDYSYGDFKKQYNILKSNQYHQKKGGLRVNMVLTMAAKEGELPLIVYALNKGASIHPKVLNTAIDGGHIEIVQYLIEKGANIHDDALVSASRHGYYEIVKYLIEHGANIHAHDGFALQVAAANGHLDIVKYLVTQGANIHIDNNFALKAAREAGHLKVATYLESLD